MADSVIVGGSSGVGLLVAQRLADRGDPVVITSREAARADQVAPQISAAARRDALDMARPEMIADARVT